MALAISNIPIKSLWTMAFLIKNCIRTSLTEKVVYKLKYCNSIMYG